MKTLIFSEDKAEKIGKATGKPHKVFWYVHPQSRLTCFAIQIKSTNEIIVYA